MEPRMKQPVFVLPDAMKAMFALNKAAEAEGLPPATVEMVHLRASQINGCALCVDIHAKELRHAGASEEKIAAVAAWREAPWFSDAERVALALTEALTRLADRPDAVPDALWAEVEASYDEQARAALPVQIGQINVWNRLNVATRQLAGSWKA